MRNSIIQIALASLLVTSGAVYGADLAVYEKTCVDLGFKKRTAAYGECVLELDGRALAAEQEKRREEQAASQREAARQKELQAQRELEARRRAELQQKAENDRRLIASDPRAAECYRLGFSPGTEGFATCQLQLRNLEQQQAAHALAEQRYSIQQQAYEEAKNAAQADALFALSRSFLGMAQGGGASSYAPSVAPPRVPGIPAPLRIITPSGNSVVCRSFINTIRCQ